MGSTRCPSRDRFAPLVAESTSVYRHAVGRNALTFARWVHALSHRLRRPSPTHLEIEHAWRIASREIAARVAVAARREQLVDGTQRGSELSLQLRTLSIRVPILRPLDFDQAWPDLQAERHPLLEDPVQLWAALPIALPDAARTRVALELADSRFNLALVWLANRMQATPTTHPEHTVVWGHPWHPMTKTRLGLGLAAHALVAPELAAQGPVDAMDVHRDHVEVTPDFSARLAPLFGQAAQGYVRIPVHRLQRQRLSRLIPTLDATVARPAPSGAHRTGTSLLSIRTVHVGDAHLKLALDMHTTSAKRVVSAMSVMNGPRVTDLLQRVFARDPSLHSITVAKEHHTAGLRTEQHGSAAHHLGVIVRDQADFGSPEAWVTACLGQPMWMRACCDGYEGAPWQRAQAMVKDYTRKLVLPCLRLLTGWGIALEPHLQNTLVQVNNGRIHGFVVRDLGGIRIFAPRLQARGESITVHPESFIVTEHARDAQVKLTHTLFHAHLHSVIVWAETCLDLPRPDAWQIVARMVSEALNTWEHDPTWAEACSQDRAALFTPSVTAKSLLAMRLYDQSSDYLYTEVPNPLAVIHR